MKKSDFLVIGSGIVGLTIAKELNARYPDSSITIIEKEKDVAFHSSGRNSGVLHAGFYYNSHSLKAQFTRDGNQAMKAYCREHKLALNDCHKVVVARNESELVTLFELEKRGKANGVELSVIDEKQLKEIDPNASTHRFALYSPTTATVDPIEICKELKRELIDAGVKFFFEACYYRKESYNTVTTKNGDNFQAGIIINTAGLYADYIARDFGFSGHYTIIPFKGIYLKYVGNEKPVRTNVYPVPNLKNPFLGVHYTVTVDGMVKIGPTSIPAFWRENYKGINAFRADEFFHIMGWEALLFFSNAFGFRSLAFEEIRKYNRSHFVNMAASLVKTVDKKGFKEWSKPGIRAQLLNTRTWELVQDFVVEGNKTSVHVLNAVSPAFTSSFPFARWIVDHYIK